MSLCKLQCIFQGSRRALQDRRSRPLEVPVSTMTQASPAASAGLQHRRVRLAAGTSAAADAAVAVRAAIGDWQVPVDCALAVTLASDLVICAVADGADGDLTLVIRCTGRRFRVEVHGVPARGDSWDAG